MNSASQVHGVNLQLVLWMVLSSYLTSDPKMLVCAARPHARTIERVVGIGFQPGLDPAILQRGSLTALAVQQHAPLIASGSAKQFIKVFSLEGSQRCTIRFNPTSIARKIGPVSHLTFHPYQVLLAAGAADALVSIYGVTFCCPNTSSHSMFLEMLCACCVEIVCYIFISLHWIGSLMLGSYLDALANNLSLSLYIYTHTCIHKKLSRSFLIFSFFFFLGVFFLLHHFAEFVKAANFIIIIILSVADK
ncbi:unnamed protein product, partial [Vitis vinifera]